MCIVKMPLKVYTDSTRFLGRSRIFPWKKAKEKDKKKNTYFVFNVHGIMSFP